MRRSFVVAALAALLLPAAASASHVPRPADCGAPGAILGTPGDDRALRGTGGPDVICGLGGDDVIYGLGGHDVIVGGDGRDLLFGGRGGDVFDGGAGTDHVSYSDVTGGVTVTIGDAAGDGTSGGAEGDDVQASVERVTGTAAADALTGDAGTDGLRGGGGADQLRGGPGDDILAGGGGPDLLRGEAGSDLADYEAATAPVRVSIGGGANDGTGGGAEGDDVGTDVERLRGGLGADQLHGNQRSNTLYGGPGADRLNGGEGDDVFFGGEGADVFNGGSGTRDWVSYAGQLGEIHVSIGWGGADDGGLTDGEQSDDVRGSVERVTGTAFPDTLIAGETPARLDGGAGPDTIVGSEGSDVLVGDDGLDGGLDAGDELYDGGGIDVLAGGLGDDTLSSRDAAFDVVDCGAGFDTFLSDPSDDYDDDCDDGAIVPVDDTATTTEDAAVAIDVLANDEDLRYGPLQVTSVTQPLVAGGTVSHTATGVTFTPTADYHGGPIYFRYYVSDGLAIVFATVTMTVTPVNDAPVLGVDGAVAFTEEDAPVKVDGSVTLSDVDDPDLERATVRISEGFAAGDALAASPPGGLTATQSGDTLTISGDGTVAEYRAALESVTYENTSDDPSTAARTLAYAVDDGDDEVTDSATVTVATVNDAPTAIALDDAAVDENADPGAVVGLLSTTDPEAGDAHVYELVAGGADNSRFEIVGGELRTKVYLDHETQASRAVRVRATDPGGESVERDFTISVADVNERPVLLGMESATLAVVTETPTTLTSTTIVADPDAGATIAGATVRIAQGFATGDVLAFTDPDGKIDADYDPVTGVLELSNAASPSAYRVALQAVTLDAATAGTRKVAFSVDDGQLESVPAERTVEAVQGNRRPVAAKDTFGDADNPATYGNTKLLVGRPANTSEPNFARTGSLLANDSDPEGTALTASNAVPSSGAKVALHTDGSFAYVPPAGFEGKDTFTYTVTDEAGRTATGTAEVWVDTKAVWYVKQGAPAGGDGRSDSPLANTAQSIGAAGDTILLYAGSPYTAGVWLKAEQTLTSDATGLTVDPAGSVAAKQIVPASGFNALIDTDSGYAVRLGERSELRRVNLDAAAQGIYANGVGDATVGANLVVYGGSHHPTVEIVGGDGDIVIDATSVGSFNAVNTLAEITNRSGGSVTVSGQAEGSGMRVYGNAADHATAFTGYVVLEESGASTHFDSVLRLDGAGSFTMSDARSRIGGISWPAVDIGSGSGDISIAASVRAQSSFLASILSRTAGTIRFTGGFVDTNLSGGIRVAGLTGGEVIFGAGVEIDTNTLAAVNLFNNDGAAVRFRGGLDATSNQRALGATGGGTVEVSGANSVLRSNGGQGALEVSDGTAIGAAGLTFKEIHANGGSHGIKLDGTGSAGGLTVTGGGTIQSTTGDAVSLANSRDVALDGLLISSAGGMGLRATEVAGTLALSDSTIQSPAAGGISVRNAATTLAGLQLTGNTVQSATTAGASSGDGIALRLEGTGTGAGHLTKGAIASNAIRNFPSGGGIRIATDQADAHAPRLGAVDSATDKLAVSGNLLSGVSTSTRMPRPLIEADLVGEGQANLEITGNGTAADRLRNTTDDGIRVRVAGSSQAQVKVDSNHVAPHGFAAGHGIKVTTAAATIAGQRSDAPLLQAQVNGNTVSDQGSRGVLVGNGVVNGTTLARISGNTVAAPTVDQGAGIEVVNGAVDTAGSTPSLCLEIKDNVAEGSTEIKTLAGINLVAGRDAGGDWHPFRFTDLGAGPLAAGDAANVAQYVGAANPASQAAEDGFGAAASVNDPSAVFETGACELDF